MNRGLINKKVFFFLKVSTLSIEKVLIEARTRKSMRGRKREKTKVSTCSQLELESE